MEFLVWRGTSLFLLVLVMFSLDFISGGFWRNTLPFFVMRL